MKTIRPALATLATLLGLHSGSVQATGETDFWQWFQRNEAMLFDFEKDQEHTFDKLAAQLHKVHSDLTFEFGPKENGKREFVISADGFRKAIPAVERLAAAAPGLSKWTVIKFRPRRAPFDIGYGNVTVKANTVAALLKPNGGKVDVTVLIPGYTAETRTVYVGIAFLMLDQALGEYDVMTRVGVVQVEAPKAGQSAVTLAQLPVAFDACFDKR